MIPHENFDILIIGAGLAGASLACALRGSRFRVGLLESQAPRPADGWDARIYAISPANVSFLGRAGAWPHLDPQRVQAVERMDVRGDGAGRLQFSAYDAGADALAYIVESSRLACELWETAKRQPNIEVICPSQAVSLAIDEAAARVTLSDGRTLGAALVVGADGVQSWTRAAAGLGATLKPYGELGVVANFVCEKPHRATAFQWFRADGVLAYLPLPENRISIVWSTPEAHAQELLALAPDALAATVAAAGQHVLGDLTLLTPAQGFPLRRMQVPQIVAPRLALIGDAAHGVHPLSGHGINLGFQDAAVLSEVLLNLPAFRDAGDLPVLQRYARARAEETWLVQGFTHGLHELFRPGVAPLSWLRNAGLDVAGKIPLLRSMAVRYAAGLW